ncbi:NAD(P)/FAD-dependent oxidoreductase [Synechococcus sp. Cruz-9H2]|uniref:NAD(P)/FAD-dependent oxidoreductase n=1 Tax=unclassified Synechococcus TaxID=2626047 RepID=UPI0020CE378A|nr:MULTISPECIES: NAD(P)/FAD-dependent oxidoreductase [unclassified Synechococcus]MCP9818847.1 NAD(P)/FAD-dependent oxidoreductase [Synechococcus sp. Cruz-9H2]MCP9843350.1 NAD(P)/FAD-dependent oxidoreductase [Synechococcus sp. Edmonson 11F2]MCP9855267.1 NAD(P)/FAD-dependent oxidoreductase [Synechococcus sp. Cruz-9C9]MCP9862760.1 NAD(P)/FAD-dependent oxidoreductase [Synechococcus sp. Cruz-7E5]MCP9869757.1 NAD(P)/FAD-dependent oxidoreductase [Synechococcus sp. Cruz-7B9]
MQPGTRVAVIGAGPAGLTAAYILRKAGVNVDVFEADPIYVGGISRTVVHNGFRFDIGGHRFFSKSNEVEAFWSEILGKDMITRDRLSRIFYDGKFYSYPLEASEVVRNLGKRESLLSIGSYLNKKLFPIPRPSNLEDWVTNKFGHRLYAKFFKSYTEKVWGVPCRDIAADWAAQRIKGLSLTRAALAALWSPQPTKPSDDRSRVIKSLIGSFRYPRLGPGMMWEATAAGIRELGGRVILGVRVTSLTHPGPSQGWTLEIEGSGLRAAGLESGLQNYDQVICSAPLSWLVSAIRPGLQAEALEAAMALKYRDFITVAVMIKTSTTFPDQWIYIHDPGIQAGRIQNFANWSPEMVPDPSVTCLGLEYFCFQGDTLWNMTDDALIALASRELVSLGLVDCEMTLDGAVVRQPKAYPVYDENYKNHIKRIREALATVGEGLQAVGRNGTHKYNNQDHSMMTGMLAAKNILSGKQVYDPWNVNQDAEYIEETE